MSRLTWFDEFQIVLPQTTQDNLTPRKTTKQDAADDGAILAHTHFGLHYPASLRHNRLTDRIVLWLLF